MARFPTEEEARAKHGGVLPLKHQIDQGCGSRGRSTGWLLVSRNPVVRGADLRDAKPTQSQTGRWEVQFVLTQDAAKRFERYTENNIGNRLAIVLDNQWRLAPTIQNKIGDTGHDHRTWAASRKRWIRLWFLRAGSLPASLVYLEESTVGPSLGADSIRHGFIAGIVGIIAVVAVMLALLQEERHQCHPGSDSERFDPDCGAGLLWSGAHVAGNRRHHLDYRYGG